MKRDNASSMKRLFDGKIRLGLIIFALVLFVTSVSANQFYQNSQEKNSARPGQVKSEESLTSNQDQTINNQENADGKTEVKVENKESIPNGTCKITKNGKTYFVPSNQVKINEEASGDVSIKVECENKVESENNSASIENNVDVKVNTSN